MIRAGDRVLAGLSGGADSTALFDVLERLSGPMGFSLRAVHVHHGLRGAEADRDAAFSERLCRERKIPFFLVRADVREAAKAPHLSLEAAGRALRYEALYRAAEMWDLESPGERPTLIAVAHHRDDQAETVLLQLARGSGLKGAAGMPPVRDRVIRPLLSVSRQEITDYLRERGISWVTDSTNLSGDYTRNRIRNQVIPLLSEAVNSRASDHLAQAAELLREADSFLEEEAGKLLERALDNGEAPGAPGTLNTGILKERHPALRKYCLRRWAAGLLPEGAELTFAHLEGLDGLVTGGTGRQQSLPGGFAAEVDRGKLILLPSEEHGTKAFSQNGHRSPERASEAADGVIGVSAGATEAADVAIEAAVGVTETSAGATGMTAEASEAVIGAPEQAAAVGLRLRIVPEAEWRKTPPPRGVDRVWMDLDQVLRLIGEAPAKADSVDPADPHVEASAKPAAAPLKQHSETQSEPHSTDAAVPAVLRERILFRHRRPGDTVSLEKGGRKLLKALLTDQKVPARERERLLAAAIGSTVLWIPGLRMGAEFRITEMTRRVLEISITNTSEE